MQVNSGKFGRIIIRKKTVCPRLVRTKKGIM